MLVGVEVSKYTVLGIWSSNMAWLFDCCKLIVTLDFLKGEDFMLDFIWVFLALIGFFLSLFFSKFFKMDQTVFNLRMCCKDCV